MPELPEVETVKNTLKLNVLNKEIKNVIINYPKVLKNVTPTEFKEKLIGEEIVDINRRGKYLIFILKNTILISHLRMEGKYNLMKDEPISKHEHIIYEFSDGYNLRYHDVRKFGTIHLYPKMELDEIYKLESLHIAPDVFSLDFNKDEVIRRLSKSHKPIKSALLDQTIMSGIGNIYVDEILFRCKIHPLEKASSLTINQVEEMIQYTKEVFNKAISLGGTTIKSFTSSHSISGKFQNELLVHTKKICPNCHKEIKKIKVGGRTSYFCEDCQKMIDKSN